MSAEEDTTTAADAPEIVSEFPAPPAFFVLYRDGPTHGPPPPEPMAPQYHMFGTPYSTMDAVPDLLPQEGKKLYLPSAAGNGELDATNASIDYKAEMKKINHSLLANFVELVDALVKNPSMFNEKLDDIELLFLNMHNLINAFRPHQARETIIQMLKTQIQDRRDAAQDIRRTIDESRKAVEQMHAQLHDSGDETHRTDGANDIKMEDAETAVAGAAANTNGTELLSPRGTQADQHAKVREAQMMQEHFFTALEASLS